MDSVEESMRICEGLSGSIYLDNASTTATDPRVIEAMLPFFSSVYGNPSSAHKEGRRSKVAIDNAREQIADLLGAPPSEIFFTSGGTESNNAALWGAAYSLKPNAIITSKLEHDSVYETTQLISRTLSIPIYYIENDSLGRLDLNNLEELINVIRSSCIVSLMHANSEIGNINNIYDISNICEKYKAFFHSDCVQSVGKIEINFSKLNINSASSSAHKFHGPKGVGFLYINGNVKISPYISGGAQERNMRGGTENVAAIVGMAKALEFAIDEKDTRSAHCLNLKKHLVQRVKEEFPSSVNFNGLSADFELSLPNIVNIDIGYEDSESLILYALDASGICVSAGSACSSGVAKLSRVISVLDKNRYNSAIRVSFSYANTLGDIDEFIKALKDIL